MSNLGGTRRDERGQGSESAGLESIRRSLNRKTQFDRLAGNVVEQMVESCSRDKIVGDSRNALRQGNHVHLTAFGIMF